MNLTIIPWDTPVADHKLPTLCMMQVPASLQAPRDESRGSADTKMVDLSTLEIVQK